MDWYVVIKNIGGRRHYYWQKTWRDGKHVRTSSKYIGPAGTADWVEPGRPKTGKTLNLEACLVAAQKTLMGDAAESWDHHWHARRHGPVLVKTERTADRALKSLGVKWVHRTDGAFYRPHTDQINIPPKRCFEDREGQSATAAYYIVVFHEVVHWTARRVLRNQKNWQPDEYALEELVAELGATALMKHFNIEIGNSSRHAKYFQTWLQRCKNRERALEYAEHEASRAVRYILQNGKIGHDQNS